MALPFITRYLEQDSPEKTALIWIDGQLTHNDLKRRIRIRVAGLKAKGLNPGDFLALHLPKGALSVECLLAGLAAGCVVIPIDPLAPSGRVKAILHEMSPMLTLTQDNTDIEKTIEPWDGPLAQNIKNSALILMTSGSTGTPKGITLSHENMLTFIDWTIRTFDISPTDRLVSIAPFHFDLSMLDIYAALLSGGTIYLPTEQEIAFPGSMAQIFKSHRPTLLYAVPSLLQIFQRFRLFEKIDFADLRWLLFAGEVFPIEALRKLKSNLTHTRLANLFGPTETNVFCWHEVKDLGGDIDALPIGQACDHSKIRILGEDGRAVKDGDAGEICVSGPTVMKGYWKDKKIVPPQMHDGFFRTGDFGYFNEGLLHYAGRRDDMAKIRGIRFSLKEVEALTLSEGSIDQAVAIIDRKGSLDAKVILHVVVKNGQEFSPGALKIHLENVLPKQAVPAAIIEYLEFPYTSNGKIDRLSLKQFGLKGQILND